MSRSTSTAIVNKLPLSTVLLGGWVGVAIGHLSGSRMVSVLAAAGWVTLCLIAGNWPGMAGIETSLAVQRLSPLIPLSERSAELGFLPDPLWPHIGFLLGLVVLAGVGMLALAARRSGQRLPVPPVLAACLAGVGLVGVGGVGVVTLHRLVVLGPERADWRPLAEAQALADDRSWNYPDDGRAGSCAGDAVLEVCVYPAYDQRLARHVLESMQPVARLVAGLPGVPTRARMIPAQAFVESSCHHTEVQIEPVTGMGTRSGNRVSQLLYADLYLGCAFGQSNATTDHPTSEAQDAVRVWALLASGTITAEELRRGTVKSGASASFFHTSPHVATLASAMAELPAHQIRIELAPVWGAAAGRHPARVRVAASPAMTTIPARPSVPWATALHPAEAE